MHKLWYLSIRPTCFSVPQFYFILCFMLIECLRLFASPCIWRHVNDRMLRADKHGGLCDSKQQKTEARTNDVFPLSARRARISVSEDSVPGHLYAWGSSAEDQSSRVTCAGKIASLAYTYHLHNSSISLCLYYEYAVFVQNMFSRNLGCTPN